MKKLCLLLLLALGLSVPSYAQRATGSLTAASSDCTTAASCLTTYVTNNDGGATFAISGTFSATVQFEATANGGTTWVALSVTPSNSTTAVTSATAAGTWQANVSGYTNVRIRVSTFASGTVVTSIGVGIASARGGSGGGGGGGGTTINSTNNVLPKRSNATTFVDSALTDNGTTVASTEPISTTGSLTAGSGCTPAGSTATGGVCATEAANTGWTPTAGFDYIRADSTLHTFVCSLNGAAEVGCGSPAFSAITSGTNSAAAMIIGTGASLAFTGTSTLDMSADTAAAALKVPVGAGFTSSANGVINYDSTAGNTHVRTAGADSLSVAEASAIAAGFLPMATDATHGLLTATLCDQAITTANTLTCTNTAGLKVVNVGTGTSPPTCTPGTGGVHCMTEGTAPTGAASVDDIYANSTTHALTALNNNTDEGPLLTASRNLIWNANQAAQSQVVVSATEYYITRSDLDMPATYRLAIGAGTTFHWRIALTKTAAGTGTFQILLKKGTNGSTADTSVVTQTIGTQTAAADNMEVDITLTFTSTTAAYWSMVPRQSAATGTGFGLVYPAAAAQFTGTISGQTTTTASDKYGVSVIFTTGTPTFVANEVFATANGVL